jgi:CBS-domain-containing membrane protein
MAHRESGRAGSLLAVCGVLAWATGAPMVFPSLGPTAFVLARDRDPGLRRVLGGHAVGALCGFLAHRSLASGLVVTTDVAPFAPAAARLAGASVLAVAVTTATMDATRTSHPPACATTLIVALGLLPSVTDLGIVVVSVGVLYAAFRVVDPD